MKTVTTVLMPALLSLAAMTVTAKSEVFTSEFVADPVSEGWEFSQEYCDPQAWNEQGSYYQVLTLDACPPGPQGGYESFRSSLAPFVGSERFFAEFRVETNGAAIPRVAPTVVSLSNSYGVLYHMTIARDRVKFLRDVELPILLIETAPNTPHTYRLELFPSSYFFYIDNELADTGTPEGPFPAHDARMNWLGSAWEFPCTNAWSYIRYGVLPTDATGDYDSNSAITLIDHYFVVDCLTKDGPGIFGGPGEDAGPGCRFTDFDADSDTDLVDFAEFQNGFGP